MNIRRARIAVALACLVVASSIVLAAENPGGKDQVQGMEQGTRQDMNRMMQGGMGPMMSGDQAQPGDAMHGNEMMGRDGMMGGMMGRGGTTHGGMMDMMRMMGACGEMMNGGGSMSGMPKLPAGNDKLQLQMQAEMMQKMGEILSSYAARIPDTPGSPR